jgi:4-amino-4-deoxy-L-arabinose transferase-like glycosyltransferase
MKPSSAWPKKHQWWPALIPIGLALIARLVGISTRPLWYDEAFAVLFSEKGLNAMLVGTLSPTGVAAADVHPLGYYSLLTLWMRLLGESPLSVRGLSVVASLLTVLVVYALANGLFGVRTALVASSLAALAPFQVHYGQEIRMYAFLNLWISLAILCYWRGSRSTGWAWWIGFALCAAAAQYTHNLAAFHLLAIAIWPAANRHWRTLKRMFVAGLAALVLYLPWLIHLPSQVAKVDRSYWIAAPDLYRLLSLLLAFVTNIPLRTGFVAPGLFAALTIAVLALIQTVREVKGHDELSAGGLWMLYLAFCAPLMMFAFSQWKPVYLERALLPAGTMFLVWIAWILTSAKASPATRILIGTALLAGFGLGLFHHVTYAGFPYAPFNVLAAQLQSRREPGDVILHSSKLSMLPMVYYDRQLAQGYIADPPGSGIDTLAPSTQKVLNLEASENLNSAIGNADRVWFLIFSESNQEYVRAGHPRHPHLTYLIERYTLLDLQHWGSLDVYLFSIDSRHTAGDAPS